MQKILLLMLIPLLGLSMQSIAQGDLMITPKRVVYDGHKQKEKLNLINTGKDTATYSISFLQYNMQEDGGMVIIDKPDSGQMFADPYLRIYPRTVTLAPGEPQVISLQYRRKPDMSAGEYRSHLYFRSEKDYNPLGRIKSKDSTKLSVQLIPIYGISIPIIIRSGEVQVNTTLNNLHLDALKEEAQTITLTINRTGNISIYGDILIQFIPKQGKSHQIAAVRGVGVYTNINKRNITVKLSNTSGEPFSNGKLKVQYVSNEKNKRVVYSEAELDL
ncbi:MAG: hypothetical protein K8S00_03190 [Bacteroidales bacterium]|nr:hypothetical protein [Bacteroidales bacterium]